MHDVLRPRQPALRIPHALALQVPESLKLLYGRADGVDALPVDAGEPLERIVPGVGKAEHLREQPLGLQRHLPVAQVLVRHHRVVSALLYAEHRHDALPRGPPGILPAPGSCFAWRIAASFPRLLLDAKDVSLYPESRAIGLWTSASGRRERPAPRPAFPSDPASFRKRDGFGAPSARNGSSPGAPASPGEHDLEARPLVDEDAIDRASEQVSVDLLEPALLKRPHEVPDLFPPRLHGAWVGARQHGSALSFGPPASLRQGPDVFDRRPPVHVAFVSGEQARGRLGGRLRFAPPRPSPPFRGGRRRRVARRGHSVSQRARDRVGDRGVLHPPHVPLGAVAGAHEEILHDLPPAERHPMPAFRPPQEPVGERAARRRAPGSPGLLAGPGAFLRLLPCLFVDYRGMRALRYIALLLRHGAVELLAHGHAMRLARDEGALVHGVPDDGIDPRAVPGGFLGDGALAVSVHAEPAVERAGRLEALARKRLRYLRARLPADRELEDAPHRGRRLFEYREPHRILRVDDVAEGRRAVGPHPAPPLGAERRLDPYRRVPAVRGVRDVADRDVGRQAVDVVAEGVYPLPQADEAHA